MNFNISFLVKSWNPQQDLIFWQKTEVYIINLWTIVSSYSIFVGFPIFPRKIGWPLPIIDPQGCFVRKFVEAPWLHTTEHDQGPFDETILEMLKLEVCDWWVKRGLRKVDLFGLKVEIWESEVWVRVIWVNPLGVLVWIWLCVEFGWQQLRNGW